MAINILGKFLSNRDNNIRFVGPLSLLNGPVYNHLQIRSPQYAEQSRFNGYECCPTASEHHT